MIKIKIGIVFILLIVILYLKLKILYKKEKFINEIGLIGNRPDSNLVDFKILIQVNHHHNNIYKEGGNINVENDILLKII